MCYFYSRGCILTLWRLRSICLLLLNFHVSQSFHHFHFPAYSRGAAVLPPTIRASVVSTTTSALAWTAARRRSSSMTLASSFYGKFEEDSDDDEADKDDDHEEEDEDDDDDDEYLDLDDKSLADFRSKMSNLYDDDDNDINSSSSRNSRDAVSSVEQLINYARSKSAIENIEPKDWARPVKDKRIQKGMVLLANPAKFCSDFYASGTGGRPNPALLAKFGLTLPPPADLGPDRRADLLPVLVIVEHEDDDDDDEATTKTQPFLLPFLSRGRDTQTRGVLLNRRTGYLLGDLEPPPPPSTTSGSDSASSSSSSAAATGMLEKFCIQPLWFGGVDNLSTGLDMLHLCPNVPDAVQLTDDGLWWGGDPGTAQDCMSDPTFDRVYTGFDFKFFAQSTVWAPGDLAKQIASDTWFCAHVSKEVLFKSRDRMGTQRAKPLWTEIMELMGGEYQDVRDKLYKNP